MLLYNEWIPALYFRNTSSFSKTTCFSLKFATRHFERNISGQADPFRCIYFYFSSLQTRDLLVRVGSIFIPLIPLSKSIGAYKRSQGQSEKRDTLIRQCRCVVSERSYIRGCRFFAPVSFRRSAFSAQPLDAEKYTGVEESMRKRQRGKEGQSGKGGRKKQTRAPSDLESGFCNMSWDVTAHLSPQFFVPCAILQFYGLFCIWWQWLFPMRVSRKTLLRANMKLDLSKWK